MTTCKVYWHVDSTDNLGMNNYFIWNVIFVSKLIQLKCDNFYYSMLWGKLFFVKVNDSGLYSGAFTLE